MRYTLVVDLVGSTVTETVAASDADSAIKQACWMHPGARSVTLESVIPATQPLAA